MFFLDANGSCPCMVCGGTLTVSSTSGFPFNPTVTKRRKSWPQILDHKFGCFQHFLDHFCRNFIFYKTFHGWNSGRGKKFSLHRNVWTNFGANPSSYSGCTKGSFLVVKQVGHKANPHLPTVLSFIMRGVTLPLLSAFKVWMGTTLSLENASFNTSTMSVRTVNRQDKIPKVIRNVLTVQTT